MRVHAITQRKIEVNKHRNTQTIAHIEHSIFQCSINCNPLTQNSTILCHFRFDLNADPEGNYANFTNVRMISAFAKISACESETHRTHFYQFPFTNPLASM